MAKFLIGLLTGVILTVLLAVVAVFSLARFGDRKARRSPGQRHADSPPGGRDPGAAPIEFPIPFLEQQTPATVKDVWDLLRKAAADSRIKAVVLEPRGQSAPVGPSCEEIRADLEQFRKSGKPLVAFLKGSRHARILSGHAADRIYMARKSIWM